MPEFLVRIHEPPSGFLSRRVVADDESVVAAALGVPAQRVLAVELAPAARAVARRGFSTRLFAQQLAVLLQAGLPLLESLETLLEKEGNGSPLAPVIDALRRGLSFSAALACAPGTFDDLTIALVAASERNGQLPQALRDHAAYLEWAEGLRARLVSAAVYPALLTVSGLAVVAFLLLFVMPRFEPVFADLGADVPAASRLLMTVSASITTHPVLVALTVAFAGALAFGIARRPAWRDAMARWVWRLPQVGRRLREIALARLYRCLAHLLGSGVPVVDALRLSGGVLPAALRDDLASAIGDVTAGHRLSGALQARGLATPVALRMLRVGESSGQVAAMLRQAAGFHDEELSRLTDIVTRTINPALMLVMGTLIGGIVVLMYLPIFTLMEQVQ